MVCHETIVIICDITLAKNYASILWCWTSLGCSEELLPILAGDLGSGLFLRWKCLPYFLLNTTYLSFLSKDKLLGRWYQSTEDNREVGQDNLEAGQESNTQNKQKKKLWWWYLF